MQFTGVADGCCQGYVLISAQVCGVKHVFVVGKFLVGDAHPLIVLVGRASVYCAFVIGFVRLYVCANISHSL